jgi:L-galactose dehydrogenase
VNIVLQVERTEQAKLVTPAAQVVHETLPALAKLKEEGLVRFIGITGLPLRCFEYVLDRSPPGLVDTVLSYCHYSLNDTSLTSLLPYLQV